MERLREYYQLTKPGIVRGNLISLVAGYVLAGTLYGFDVMAFVGVFIGTALVIASGCVFNNYVDRHIDAKMERTKKRALVRHTISNRAALVYATILGVVGIGLLWLIVNPLATIIGIVGLVWYVIIYGYAKRHTPWSTLVGTVCGATPPLAGYVAITGQLDAAAVILFAILTVWQMPHFYAIAIRREADYRAGGIPVLAVVKGAAVTKTRIVAYLVLFCLTTPLLSLYGYTGMVYLVGSITLALYWLGDALRTWSEPDDMKWAGRVFGISLLVLFAQSVLIATGHILP